MEYKRRVVDEQFALKMEALGAVQIKGPKGAEKQQLQNKKQEV